MPVYSVTTLAGDTPLMADAFLPHANGERVTVARTGLTHWVRVDVPLSVTTRGVDKVV